jgi:hypothetical protein
VKLNKFQSGFVIVLVTLSFFGLITWLFEDFVWNQIVSPLYAFIVVIGIIINAIPQFVYVVLLIGLGFLMFLRSLTRLGSSEPERPVSLPNVIRPSRFQVWRSLIERLDVGEFSRETFALELRRLVLSILSYQEGIDDPIELQKLIANGSISVPVEVANLIDSRVLPEPERKEKLWDRLARRFGVRLSTPKKYITYPEVAEPLDQIIHFIEMRLEVNRGIDKQ